MLDTAATAPSTSGSPTSEPSDGFQGQAGRRVELLSEFDHPHYDPHHPVARANDRWICTACGARPTSCDTGRCECDLPQPDGSDVRCIGTLRPVYTSRAWCDGCGDFVPGHLVGLCFGCEFDAELPRTVEMPAMSLRDAEEEAWRRLAMVTGASAEASW